MSDEPESTEAPEEAAAEGAESEGGGVAVAVRDESPPAVPMGPSVDPHAEARKSRLVLPLLIPLGAIAVVAFVALNISRVFLAASEGSSTFAVCIAAGITVAILVGATVVAAVPTIRTTSLIVGLAVVMLVVLLAGSLVLGASLPKSDASKAYVEPAGPAINTLEVDAFPELKFQAKKFEVPGGVNLIKYNDKGGTHTLVFDQNAVPGFLLAVPGGKNALKVDLKPGQTYTIFCTLPGHRAAGMEADIVVGAAGGKPEAGTQTPTPTLAPATPPSSVKGGSPNSDPASQSSTGGS